MAASSSTISLLVIARPPTTLAIAAIAALLLLNVLWTGIYNQAVTGSPWQLPHRLYAKTYMTAPNFLFQEASPRPEYRHPEMARFHAGWEQEHYAKQLTARGWFEEKRLALATMWSLYLGVALTVPLLLLPWSRRDPWMLLAIGLWLLLLATASITTWNMPHYSAPLAPLLFVLVAQGVRSAYDSPRWHSLGVHLRRALPVVCLAVLAYGLVHPNQRVGSPFPSWYLQRAQILEDLAAQGGQHLIIVRYRRDSSRHYPHEEWVYNAVDIDAAAVVWARKIGNSRNRRLRRYFADHTVWLLEPDVDKPQLQPYP